MSYEDIILALKDKKQIVCGDIQQCIETLLYLKSMGAGFQFDEYTRGLMDGTRSPDLDYLSPGLSRRGAYITCFRNDYASGISFEDIRDLAVSEDQTVIDEAVGPELVSGLFALMS